MIIDSHVHIGKTEKIKRFFTFESFSSYADKLGGVAAITIPNISSKIPFSTLNEKFINEYKKLSIYIQQKFLPAILIDPNDMETLDQITDGIFGVKYHPSVSSTPINDPKVEEFLNLVSIRHLPVIVHCGRNEKSHISYLIEAANKFKNIKFIAAHMGGNATDLIEKALDLVFESNLKNIYFDTSAVKLPWLVENAVRLFGSERILFGSDEPYSDIRIGKYCIELSNISQEEKDNIFYRNVEHVFRIK